MEITLTAEQLYFIADTIGDVKRIKLVEGNGGNIDVLPDCLEEEKFTVDEHGDEL